MTRRNRYAPDPSTLNFEKTMNAFANQVSQISDQVWEKTFAQSSEQSSSRDDYLFTIGMGMFETEVSRLKKQAISDEAEFIETLDSLTYMTEWLDKWIAYLDDPRHSGLVSSLREVKGKCLDASIDLIAAWLIDSRATDDKPTIRHHSASNSFAEKL